MNTEISNLVDTMSTTKLSHISELATTLNDHTTIQKRQTKYE